MANTIFDAIDKTLDVIDRAVTTRDYSHMSDEIRDAFSGMGNDPYKEYKDAGGYKAGRTRSGGGTPYEPYRPPFVDRPSQYRSGYTRRTEDAWRRDHSQGGSGSTRASGAGGFWNDPGTFGSAAGRRSTGTAGAQAAPGTGDTPYFKATKGGIGTQASFLGALCGTVFVGIGAFISFIGSLLVRGTALGPVGFAFTFLFALIAVTCGVIAVKGKKNGDRLARYAQYRKLLEEDLYMDIDDLAARTGVDEKTIRADLKALMKSGYFKQGHFDDKETCFIASDELYGQYRTTMENAARLAKEREETLARDGVLPEDVRDVLEKGSAYIKKIHEANDAIPGEEVSRKLDRMESIVTRIFEQVRKEPVRARDLSMFMDYYLPTTAKLIDAYLEMDAQTLQGENVVQAKKEIEESLDTINDAFEKLLDGFFRDKALDVATDISVMKTVMRQQGLTPDELEAFKQAGGEEPALEFGPTLEELQEQIAASEKVPEKV